MFVMLLALWNCIKIPFDVSFRQYGNVKAQVQEGFDFDKTFERFIDVLFFMDVIIAMRTTFINEKTGFEVVDGSKIVWNYFISGRLFVDLAASIPFEEIYILFSDEGQTDQKATQLLGLLKLVRLLRLGRIIRYMKFKQGLKVGIRMFQLLLFLCLLIHWIACVWYIII